MSRIFARLQPVRSFCSLYFSILREGGLKYWKRVILIGGLDFAAVFSATSTMLVIAVIVSGAAKGDLVSTINHVLQYVNLEIAGQKSAQLLVLIGGGVLSAGLILFAAIARFIAAFNGRKIARLYHKELIYELFRLFEGIKILPDLPSIERGSDLNIAVIQDTIHASKALETLLRLPQVAIFSFFLMVVAFKMQPGAMTALITACLIGLPVVIWTGRRIQSASSDFFEKSSRYYGERVGHILNGFETCATPYPTARVEFDEKYEKSEESYFGTFDNVQLASDRMNLASSFVRALGFGTAFVYVSSLVVIQGEDLAIVIAFATLVYLFVSQLQNLFGSLSTLVVFYPQARRLFTVREQLYASQKPDGSASIPNASLPLNSIISHASDFKPENAEEKAPIIGAPVIEGTVFNLIVNVMPGKFNLVKDVSKLNLTLSEPVQESNLAYFRSAGHDFSEITLDDLDRDLLEGGYPSLEEIAAGLKISDELTDWRAKLGLGTNAKALSSNRLTAESGTLQGLVLLSVALVSGAKNLFLDRTYITRFHGDARKYALSLFPKHVLWLMSVTDISDPAADEELKVNLRIDEPIWTYLEDVLEDAPEVEGVGSDDSVAIIM